jgi:hypothetical protein
MKLMMQSNKCVQKLWDYVEKWQYICSCVLSIEWNNKLPFFNSPCTPFMVIIIQIAYGIRNTLKDYCLTLEQFCALSRSVIMKFDQF